MTDPQISDPRPLAGLTVLDLTRVRAGPTCVRQLADWGADVVKIEGPGSDKEELGGPRTGPDFQNLHRNKRSMTLDLKEARGREVFRRLARTADVVVENYRPDVKTRLGIDYETLRAINPRLIYASISGFGQDGPYRDRPGFDQIAQGMGGLMSITGRPGEGPMRVGIPVADLCAGLFAAQGILLALIERGRSGLGQAVESSLLQAQIFMLDFQAARWLIGGEVAGQAGNNHPTSIPTGVVTTRDGFMNIATSGDPIWERFARAIGGERLLADPLYATAESRSANRDALGAEIDGLMAREDTATWTERLNEAGVPSGPIYTIDQVFADPQVRHLGVTARIDSPHLGPLEVLAQPVRLSRTRSAVTRHSPACGEHTDEVLSQAAYAAHEIADLHRDGIV